MNHTTTKVLSSCKQGSGQTWPISASGIPNGWPQSLDGPLAWDRTTSTGERDFTYELSNVEITEVETALKHFKDLRLYGNEVNCCSFPLPTLSKKLHYFALELHEGRGFFALRGLNPARYSVEDNMLIFLGVSSYIGEKRGKQDSDGNMIGHIQEAKDSKVPQRDRPSPNSNLAVKFHTDMFCDIVAMQTRSCAAKGGQHIIASAWNVYNDLVATRPDLISLLASTSWGFDVRGRLAEPRIRPLLYYHEGHMILNFSRYPLEGCGDGTRATDLPTMSELQRELLDLVESIAERHQINLQMQPGDLTFINNFAMLHSRESFIDDTFNSRYLVRLWLKNDRLAWQLPHPLRTGNRTVFESNDVEEKWNIVAVPKLRFPIHERLGP
ncbi:MAG: hypothetical protein MMC33_001299 [Icmadophila ericetorum]|nr:hypothetical protein [Icmadophila ericetorum]